MLNARRLGHRPEIRFERIVGGQHRGRDGHDDDRQGDNAPTDRERGAPSKGDDRSPRATPGGGRSLAEGRKARRRWPQTDLGRGAGHGNRILGSSQAMMMSMKILSRTKTTA